MQLILPILIMFCVWAHAYYDHKRAEGKGYNEAIRALAYRWIRIIYRCWKDHLPYNEQLYTQSLQQRRPAWFVSWSAPSPQESILDTPPRSIENTFSKKVE
jgi:hypothetical protein